MNGTAWTKREITKLRRRYGKSPAKHLAHEFGRTTSQIYQAAMRYGCTTPRRKVTGPDFDRFIRAKHKLGWHDREIAAAWSQRHPSRTASRKTVRDRRQQLALPSNALNERHRRKVAKKTREQLRRAGLKSLADVRRVAFEKFAAQRGWPKDLAPRQVQMLDLMYEQGPRTRRQMAEHLGESHKTQQNWFCASRNNGGKQYQGQNYLADLVHRGLVVRLPGRSAKSGPSKYHNCHLYAVALHVRRNA